MYYKLTHDAVWLLYPQVPSHCYKYEGSERMQAVRRSAVTNQSELYPKTDYGN